MPQTPVTNYEKVNTTTAGAQFAPAIAVLSGGGYIIVWQDASAGAVYGQRYSASGQKVGAELHLSSTQGGSPVWVSVAATANDGFVIAFQAGSFAQAEIFGQRYDGGNNPAGGLFAVNSTSPNEQYNPRITTLDNGNLLFTWDTQAFDVFQEVRGRVFTPAGEALGNDFPVAPMSAAVEHGLSTIAPLAGGGFVVTWQTAALNGSDFDIVGQRFNAVGAPAGAQFQVNGSTTNAQYGNDVARLSDGGFVVSWVDDAPGNGGGRVLARHYDAGFNPVGGEIVIDSKASGAYGRTVVTALANGGYVVGWTEDDGAGDNVLARAMGANDVPLDPAFEMSFDSTFNANYFADGAVTLPNGNVVFAWDGPSAGTGQDIYMRVYSFGGGASGQPTNGPDMLTGTSGPDTLDGLGGADTMRGLDGNDFYRVDNAGDVAIEEAGQGNDRVFASVSYTLGAGQSVEMLTTDWNPGTAAINLAGNALANTIYGNDGANLLDGKGGADILVGRLGNDSYFVDNAADYVLELAGQGSDRVYANVSFALTAGMSVEMLTTGSNTGTTALNLTGNELANQIYGNDGNNLLDGRGGADALVGRLGNDNFFVDNAADYVLELAGQGSDRVYAGASYTLGAGQSVEMLTTSSNTGTSAINLTGNELANAIYGNDGANMLDGKGGSDFLSGRAGADLFAFTTALGAGNVDTVYDFQSGVDRIALDDAIFAGIGGPGAFTAAAFVTGSAAADGNDRIIYNGTTGQLFYDADGTGGGAAVLFATLTGHPALAASDFTVI